MPPTITPSGVASLPMQALRSMLASSSNWKTLVGAAAAGDATCLAHIHYFGVDAPSAWSALKAVSLQQFVRVEGAPLVFECTTAGTTGATSPTWPTAAGQSVADGSAAWTARALYAEPFNSVVRASRPFAIVGQGDDLNLNMSATGGSSGFEAAGELILLIEADTPAAYQGTFEDAGLWFANLLGALVADLRALAGTPGYLNVTSVELREFSRTDLRDPDETAVQGDCWQAQLALRWEGV
ncbi:MAG TPA: hypothetical protein P5137_00960 [Candidatus Brocadiia bacterium]|nr:hypothetical protein [Candidatus Brocadiia bacterium]